MPNNFLVSLSMEVTFFQCCFGDFIVTEVNLCFYFQRKNGIGIETENL